MLIPFELNEEPRPVSFCQHFDFFFQFMYVLGSGYTLGHSGDRKMIKKLKAIGVLSIAYFI